MNRSALGILLHSFDVYDALQFILGARKAIMTACFCKDFIEKVSNEIENEHADWMENWEWEPLENNKKVLNFI